MMPQSQVSPESCTSTLFNPRMASGGSEQSTYCTKTEVPSLGSTGMRQVPPTAQQPRGVRHPGRWFQGSQPIWTPLLWDPGRFFFNGRNSLWEIYFRKSRSQTYYFFFYLLLKNMHYKCLYWEAEGKRDCWVLKEPSRPHTALSALPPSRCRAQELFIFQTP